MQYDMTIPRAIVPTGKSDIEKYPFRNPPGRQCKRADQGVPMYSSVEQN
jgi:hypothetical protein